MKLFLVNSGCAADQISQVLQELASKYPEVEIIQDTQEANAESIQSDSVVVICFVQKNLLPLEYQFVQKYQEILGKSAVVIPVAFGQDTYIEGTLSQIKSQATNEQNWLKNLTNRIGAFLGLKCIPKDHQIFISYRKIDGEDLSKKISDHFEGLGFAVWRDENRDEDNEGNLTVGTDVQATIRKALHGSSVVLLVDTPLAPSSKWVHDEIDMAHEHLIPIFPVCFTNGSTRGSNFRGLRTLNRFCESDASLTNLNQISNDLLQLLTDVYKRKRKIPTEVSRKFFSTGYSWTTINEIKLLFESAKQRKFSSIHKLLSHCPVYDGIHDGLVHNFINEAKSIATSYNHRLFIYDGMIHTSDEIQKIISSNLNFQNANIVLLHHEQIEEFLDEN